MIVFLIKLLFQICDSTNASECQYPESGHTYPYQALGKQIYNDYHLGAPNNTQIR